MTYKPTTTTPGKRYDHYRGEILSAGKDVRKVFNHWLELFHLFNAKGQTLQVFSVPENDTKIVGLINELIEQHTKK